MEELDKGLRHPAPAPGIEKAPVAPPGWCKGVQTGTLYPNSLAGTIAQYDDQHPYFSYLVDGAKQLCGGDPKNPVIQRTTQEILQLWMNSFGTTAKESTEDIALRLNQKAFDAGHDAACTANVTSDETGGDERAQITARRALFFCDNSERPRVLGDVAEYFDATSLPIDPLAELAYALSAAQYVSSRQADARNRVLPQYAADQVDYALVDPNAVWKAVDHDYKDNAYVRIAVYEALGAYRMARAVLDADLKAATKDPDFKAVLIDAPQKGIAAWNAAAAKYKDALARSNQFEHAALGPSRKAMAGCEPVLRKDLGALLKTFKHADEAQLQAAISDSLLGGLLLNRYIVCVAAEGDAMASREMLKHAERVRIVRGPRQAAAFAAIDAVTAIKDDRPKFALDESDFPQFNTRVLNDTYNALANKRSTDAFGYGVWHEQGVVKSVTKAGGVLKVVFAPDRHKVPTLDCHFTNRIITFDASGTPIYDQSCRKTGTHIEDYSPEPIEVSVANAAGLARGRFIAFEVARGKGRPSMPTLVWADKTQKKLTAWNGFEL